MRTIFTLLVVAVYGMHSASAQVSKIEQKSRENNSPPANSGSSSSGSSGSSRSSSGSSPKYDYDSRSSSNSGSTYYYYEDNAPSYNYGSAPYYGSGSDGCTDACSGCVGLIGDLIDYQKKLVTDKDNPMATSVELMPHVAYGSMQILSYIPRIRATYGILSSDFRVTSLNDMSPAEGGTYYTYDWQVLQLNLLNQKHLGFYVGGGVMVEHTSTTIYEFVEISAGFLLREFGNWSGALEWRTAGGDPSPVVVRSEYGARINYTFLRKKPFYVNATAGTLYQNYYESVPVWSGVGGFSLVLK